MLPSFDYEFDPDIRLLEITPHGFWDSATASKFAGDILARSVSNRAKYGTYAVLVDLRSVPIQAPAVVAVLEKLITTRASIDPAPSAAVVGSTLAKLQFRRVFNHPNCSMFLNKDAARAWLDEVWTKTL